MPCQAALSSFTVMALPLLIWELTEARCTVLLIYVFWMPAQNIVHRWCSGNACWMKKCINEGHHQGMLAVSWRDWAPSGVSKGQNSVLCSGVLCHRDELPGVDCKPRLAWIHGALSGSWVWSLMAMESLSWKEHCCEQHQGTSCRVFSKPFLRRWCWPERLVQKAVWHGGKIIGGAVAGTMTCI